MTTRTSPVTAIVTGHLCVRVEFENETIGSFENVCTWLSVKLFRMTIIAREEPSSDDGR